MINELSVILTSFLLWQLNAVSHFFRWNSDVKERRNEVSLGKEGKEQGLAKGNIGDDGAGVGGDRDGDAWVIGVVTCGWKQEISRNVIPGGQNVFTPDLTNFSQIFICLLPCGLIKI